MASVLIFHSRRPDIFLSASLCKNYGYNFCNTYIPQETMHDVNDKIPWIQQIKSVSLVNFVENRKILKHK